MVYPGTLFHRRQQGKPMHSYENRSQIRAQPARSEVRRAGQEAAACAFDVVFRDVLPAGAAAALLCCRCARVWTRPGAGKYLERACPATDAWSAVWDRQRLLLATGSCLRRTSDGSPLCWCTQLL
jgi:hypothetical protein